MADVMSTADIVRRLRDGVPCIESSTYGHLSCRDRSALAGCDCTIAADKIEALAADTEQMKAAADRAGYFFFGHVDGTYTLQQK